MKLILIRHGQSEDNTKGLISGPHETPLTQLGKEQAEAIAERLKDEHFDIAYTSTLSRAKDTAKTILQYHPDIALIEDSRITEWNRGIFEGKPSSEFRDWAEKTEGYEAITPEGGESLNAFKERLNAFLLELQKKEYKKVLIVSHGAVIRIILMMIAHAPQNEFRKYLINNASLNIVDLTNKKIEVMNNEIIKTTFPSHQ